MSKRRFSVALPTPVAEDLAAMATRSGVRPSEVLAEALYQFEPFQAFTMSGNYVPETNSKGAVVSGSAREH